MKKAKTIKIKVKPQGKATLLKKLSGKTEHVKHILKEWSELRPDFAKNSFQPKKKTFILRVSKTFMANHPKAGEKTYFKELILTGSKIHTIRGNYQYWKKIIDQVNKGKAIISLRQWTGKPFRSKQEEFKQLSHKDGVGIQKISKMSNYIEIDKRPKHCFLGTLAKNDGLGLYDFLEWFRVKKFKGCIIHFTKFRY